MSKIRAEFNHKGGAALRNSSGIGAQPRRVGKDPSRTRPTFRTDREGIRSAKVASLALGEYGYVVTRMRIDGDLLEPAEVPDLVTSIRTTPPTPNSTNLPSSVVAPVRLYPDLTRRSAGRLRRESHFR